MAGQRVGDSTSPEADGRSKRRRTALACDECRERKRKCDGVKPVCSACAKRPLQQCIWNDERNTKGWSNSYVESLKNRIRQLEKAHQQSNSTTSIPNGTSSRPVRSSHSSAFENQPSQLPDVGPTSETVENRQLAGDAWFDAVMGNSISDQSTAQTRNERLSPSLRFGQEAHHTKIATASDVNAIDGGDESEDIDAMGVFGGINGEGRPRRRSDFFGPSSTINFLSQARRDLSHSTSTQPSSGPTTAVLDNGLDEAILAGESHPSNRGLPETPSKTVLLGLSVPPRAEADNLIESYWTWFHSLYPFLHRPSFDQKYFALWDPSKAGGPHKYYCNIDDKLFHCLLNVMFAIGCHFNPSIAEGDRDQAGMVFFERSKRLVDFNLLAHGSPVLVQTLLLMGQYLQSTDMPSSCWNIVGLAIRTAQGIGLHHDSDVCEPGCCPKEKFNQIEKEMRRRMWTGCILLDRVLSMTYGRPLMIHPSMLQNQLALPSPIDDHYLTEYPSPSGAQPRGITSVIDCYIQAVKLSDILGQVLATFYYGSTDIVRHGVGDSYLGPKSMLTSSNTPRIRSSDIQMLLDFDGSLTAWHKNLPHHLKINSYSDKTSGTPNTTYMYHRQANALETRFLHVRLIMFRPVLSLLFQSVRDNAGPNSYNNDLDSSMHHEMLLKAAYLCVSAAQELVDLITDNYPSEIGLLPPSWYNVFYIHSCAIVILVSRFYSSIEIQDEESLTTSWNKCLAFLRSYQTRSRSARRCCKILELVQQEVFSCESSKSYVVVPRVGDASQPSRPSRDNPSRSDLGIDSSRNHPVTQGNYDATENLDINVDFDHTTAFLGDTSDMALLSSFPFFEEFDFDSM